jgi:hypothetical protein
MRETMRSPGNARLLQSRPGWYLPYLVPLYDDPSFVVRSVYRLFGGWYSGFIPDLHPARNSATGALLRDIFTEIADVSLRSSPDGTTASAFALIISVNYLRRILDDELSAFATAAQQRHVRSSEEFADKTRSVIAVVEYLVASFPHDARGREVDAVLRLREDALLWLHTCEMSLMGRGVYASAISDTRRRLMSKL